jgi:Kef-type K+ transport system membrane component KefB
VLTEICGGARLLSQEGDLGELSELGVLFLLFEMGLELNIDRLTVTPASACRACASVG